MAPCLYDATPVPAHYFRRASGKQANARAHRIAEGLQRVLLRSRPREALPNLATEAFYEAALSEATVGGDSFDVFALDDGRTALAVADASGKGLAAAERVAEIRFALRAFLREHRDPGQALSCLNEFVCISEGLSERDGCAFVTLSLVVLDNASGVASCLCAGGEPPLVLRATGAIEVVQICGVPLGMFPNRGYAAAPLRLEPGDTILLFTDGLTEAHVPTKERRMGAEDFLSLEGIARLATQSQNLVGTLPEVGQSIFEGARRFAGGTFHDDACLLAAKWG